MIYSQETRKAIRRRFAAACASLREDRRGAVAIEFAFVATPLAALMVASVQTSLVFFAQQTLESAAEKSVRQLMTGQAQSANMTQTQFKALVCSKLANFMGGSDCATKLLVDVRTAASFADASTAAPTITFDNTGKVNNSWSYTPGQAGSINIVRIMYLWDVPSGPLGFDLSTMSSSRRMLYAVSVFKTEPYS
ncbi:MAG: TadE/TadG family type IV pilus assembly protein [Sphingomonas sp.]